MRNEVAAKAFMSCALMQNKLLMGKVCFKHKTKKNFEVIIVLVHLIERRRTTSGNLYANERVKKLRKFHWRRMNLCGYIVPNCHKKGSILQKICNIAKILTFVLSSFNTERAGVFSGVENKSITPCLNWIRSSLWMLSLQLDRNFLWTNFWHENNNF